MQATTCGGSMALRMAGVPIKGMVAGISVGLVTEHWPKSYAGPAESDWVHGHTDYGSHALMLGTLTERVAYCLESCELRR